MGTALKGKPAIQFRVPPGVRLVRVDASTGELPPPGDRNVILEAFRPGTEPQPGEHGSVPDGSLDEHEGISGAGASAGARSEAHTYDTQSLMRISYAVFCFEKKHK